MATKKRKRRIARIASLTVTLMIALLWLASMWILVIAKPTSNTIVAIYSGGVGLSVWPNSVLSDDDKSRLRLFVNESPTRWLPT